MPKPAYTIFLRTGAACNIGCITCPAGRKEPEERQPGSLMKPDMLRRVIRRVQEQNCKVIQLAYHYYNEPMLNPDIAELVHVGEKEFDIRGTMSTHLNNHITRCIDVLRNGLTTMIISLSGFTQETYGKSHKGGDIELVKRNMKHVSDFLMFNNLGTFVRVSWHRYKYNEHEEPLMKEFCENLGFHFTPYDTGVLPLERVMQRWRDGLPDIAERDVKTPLQEAKKLCFDRKHWSCIHQDRLITVDSNGDLHSCCVKNHQENITGNIFKEDLEQWNHNRKYNDAACKACKAVGLHVYAMQQYRRPNTILVKVGKRLEDAWRRNNLGGIFPWISAKWGQLSYDRPQTKGVK